MTNKVFISGSIAIPQLPRSILLSLEKMIDNNLEILVGDASGIDEKVQQFFAQKNYNNLTVYSIYNPPRNRVSSSFKMKFIEITIETSREREKQKVKDKAMTYDSDFSLVIWDGRSRGSYANILRSLDQNKPVKVYLLEIKDFLDKAKITKPEIEFIYRNNNGYTAAEVVDYLIEAGIQEFKNTREFNKYLIGKKIIEKQDSIYIPLSNNKSHFIIEKYQGKVKGLRFTNDFIQWLEIELKKLKNFEQNDMFV